MDIEKLEPNSHKYNLAKKEEGSHKETDPNKKGKIIEKKKTVGSRFASLFLSEDIGNVKEYIIYDVIIPAIKDGFYDVLTRGADMLFYGRSRGGRRRPVGGEYYSYNQCSNSRTSGASRRSEGGPRYSGRISPNDIGYKDRYLAEEKKEELEAIFDNYHQISVADVFDVAGVTGNGSVDNDYGWYSMKDIYVSRYGNEYCINFPRPVQLD